MLSKELFIETIELIKKKREHEDKLCEALELCSPQEYVNAFIYSEYETQMVKILHAALYLAEDDDTLEYWIWDCEFGKTYTLGDITENDNKVDLSTVDKLYDYLVRNKK